MPIWCLSACQSFKLYVKHAWDRSVIPARTLYICYHTVDKGVSDPLLRWFPLFWNPKCGLMFSGHFGCFYPSVTLFMAIVRDRKLLCVYLWLNSIECYVIAIVFKIKIAITCIDEFKWKRSQQRCRKQIEICRIWIIPSSALMKLKATHLWFITYSSNSVQWHCDRCSVCYLEFDFYHIDKRFNVKGSHAR